ncbi:MAG: hypothetical protein R3B84_23495 [Zavarzinella sp.]
MSTRIQIFAILLISLFVLTGCGSGDTGTITGKVTYKGSPVSSGSINFMMPETGSAAQADLNKNGEFTLSTPLKTGTYKVYFLPPPAEQLPPGQMSKPNEFVVPKLYQDVGTTTITKEITSGANKLSIEIPH